METCGYEAPLYCGITKLEDSRWQIKINAINPKVNSKHEHNKS